MKKAFYKHYKKDFNLSVDAKLVYGENGQVVNVIMNTKHPKYKAFLEDVKDALYYVWDSPKIDNDGVGDFIIKSIKLHLSFSRKYRMACKQNGQPAKDSVEFVGYSNAQKNLCSEIIFTKDLATGGVNHYECNEFNKEVLHQAYRFENKIIPVYKNYSFDRSYAVNFRNFPLSQVIKIKIPPCFVEEE